MLAIMLLVGCGRNNSVKETVAPVVTAEPTNLSEPVASPETGTVITQEHGDRNEGTVSDPVQTFSPVQGSVSGPFTGVMGTEFTVPEGFIQLDESPSIGYQYTFWHPEHEIRIVVYEIAPGYIPEGAYETDFNIAKNNPDVTYFNHGENWFVQSGYNHNGEEIFYSKESSTDNGLKTFWINYPTAKREFGDPIAADFEKNCRF
jgi:hypothetical protein